MPWGPSEAHDKTHKANTPKKKRQWAHIADQELARGVPEGKAVKIANGVLARAARRAHG